MSSRSLQVSSLLSCPIEPVLDSLNMSGVNAELGPWVRMTSIPEYRDVPFKDWPARQPLFSSWILLLGVLPIDRHDFYFDSIESNGFSEASSSLMNASWKHRREVTEEGECTRVTDTVEYVSRMPFLVPLLHPIFKWIFHSRHRNLHRQFGSVQEG